MAKRGIAVERREVPMIFEKKLVTCKEIKDFFQALESAEDEIVEVMSKQVNLELNLHQIYYYFHRRDFIRCLTLLGNVSSPIFLLTDWKVLQCLTIDVEANTLHFPAMLQHLDITFSKGINIDNLKAIDKLRKLSFLRMQSKLHTSDGGFGLLLRNLGCEVKNVLESLVLSNLSKVYSTPEDVGRLLDVNPSIRALSLTMEKSSELFEMFTKDFTSYLTNQKELEYLHVCGVKMFSFSSFEFNVGSFAKLQHLFIHNSDFLDEDCFNCLREKTPLLHYLSLKHTKVNLECLGMFLVAHQNLSRITLFIEDYETAFPDNLEFKLDMMRYILCFKSWLLENVCFCHYFSDEYVENLRTDLAGCIAKHKQLNDSLSEMKDPMSCSIEVLKELILNYVYQDVYVNEIRFCDEEETCVGVDCNVYLSDTMLCSCHPVDRKNKH